MPRPRCWAALLLIVLLIGVAELAQMASPRQPAELWRSVLSRSLHWYSASSSVGNLTLIANDLLANGVVDAHRDAGAAVISMAAGTVINAGTGTVVIELRSGAGLTNATSADVTLQTVSGEIVSITNAGPAAGSDVLVHSITATATLTMTSAGRIEEAGADAAADLTATTLNLTAVGGIGSLGTLEIDAAVAAASVTGAGAIDLRDLAGGLFASSAATFNGAITLAAQLGNLTINTVMAGGGGAVNLSNSVFGTVQVGALSTAGNLGIASVWAVALDSSLAVGGAMTVNAGGALSVAANFTAQAAVNLTASSIAFTGDLDVGNQIVTLTTGGSSAHLGGVTTVGPTGQLIAANGVTVGSGGVLSGTGLVDVGVGAAGLKVLASGTVAPGASPGTLTVDGDLVLNTGAILAIELNGTGAGLFDELIVNGAVSLGGATLAVILGYTPTVGHAFQIITNDLADSVTGTFAAADSLAVGSTTFDIIYNGGSNNDVVLTVAPVGGGGGSPAATANGDVFSLPEDSGATALGVMTNDLGAGLTITAITQAVNGTVVITGGGTGLTYQPSLHFTGVDSFSYTITDSLSNTSTATVIVAVTPVNDAPVLAAPASAVMRVNTFTAIAGITVNDIDAGSNPLQVIVSALTGSLTLGSLAGLSFTVGDGTADTTMTFTGTLASINNALAGLGYRGAADTSAADTVTVTVNDQGHQGSGGNQSDSANIAINPNFNTVQVLADPFKAGTKALVVNGTAGNDIITITPVGNANTTKTFRVKINGGPLQTFTGVTGRILAYGHDGDDKITLGGTITRRSLLVGGDGNDSLTGARGADTLTGGLGNDTLNGLDAGAGAEGPGPARTTPTGDSRPNTPGHTFPERLCPLAISCSKPYGAPQRGRGRCCTSFYRSGPGRCRTVRAALAPGGLRKPMPIFPPCRRPHSRGGADDAEVRSPRRAAGALTC